MRLLYCVSHVLWDLSLWSGERSSGNTVSERVTVPAGLTFRARRIGMAAFIETISGLIYLNNVGLWRPLPFLRLDSSRDYTGM